ncbi:MAG: hypothetical protein BAA02_02290 [Paenibacillaceae bacterium ZCTH02-B3]|nr:MAG: hypothetical protein BAA02_02290 [Paenibacillaceae bacterium ZCTH02-B3]
MGKIIAVVTARREEVTGGGAPVFAAGSPEAAERLALELEKVLDCAASRIGDHHFVLVERTPPVR